MKVFLTVAACLLVLLPQNAFAADLDSLLVTIRYPASNLAPGAAMGLCGSFPLSWDNSMTAKQIGDNAWQVVVPIGGILNESQRTWQISMKTIVGENGWQVGANDRVTLVLGKTTPNVTLYPYYMTKNGQQMTIKGVFSPQLNNSRDVWIYIPPVMVENPFAVMSNTLIMHDGQNLSPLWKVPETLDDLIVGGQMVSVFIIGPYNTDGNRINEYTYCPDPNYGGGEGEKYLDFLEQTLLPLVKKQFPNILTAKENLGTLGSSLGGLISCYAGITRPKVYSKLGCMSSSFWWDYRNFSKWVVPKISGENVGTQTYYLDSGDSGNSDDGRPDTSQVASQMVQKGFVLGDNFYWYLQRGGEHNEYYWSKRFHFAMQWLYFRDGLWNGPWSG